MSALWPILLVAALAAPAFPYEAKVHTQQPKTMVAEGLGPSAIDISDYPAEYQRTYQEIFVPFFTRYGGTARMVNSPLITSEEWKKEIERIRTRPPCCSSCPYLSLKDARALWKFMVYDSARRKTGSNAAAWQALRRQLAEGFKKTGIGGAR